MRPVRKRRLVDLMEVQLPGVDPNTGVLLDNMLGEWVDDASAPLSVVLVELQFLGHVHQTHHWISRGDSYYGDHLLFQRLYETTQDEVDRVAERAVGAGDERAVDLTLRLSQLQKLVQGYGPTSTVPGPGELARRSLALERSFLILMSQLTEAMRERGTLTRGIDNMLGAIEDAHEGHVYLLKQRCGR